MTKLSERFCAVDCDAPLWAIEEVIKLEEEIERLRADLERKSDTAVRNKWMAEVMQEEVKQLRADAERWNWFVRHASLGFDASPSWNAVIRLPVFSSDDDTITKLVDRGRREAK